ncbi:DsbC family protein [Aquabacterium humicola]|uniref:DsbC family protein n=1 Tax=Aquabacterium humicola TaxID=3237377 RepID=UPI002542B66B|nr:DsbC family protein [Rubrivivax pictus]
MKPSLPMLRAAAFAVATLAAVAASADEAAIRKTLAERLPNMPKIDEVTKTPIPGLYEVRMGTEIVYTDENGHYVVQGALIDTKTRSDLTQARIDKLTAFDFAALPLKDAVLVKQGSGARKLVVFADPNCGYCKRIERDLMALKDVSIYTFLYPILGTDSTAKSKDIWCAKDAGKAWRAWMLDGVTPPKSAAECDVAALDRNLKLGQKHRVTGTPAVVFEDGSRAPGAVPAAQIESRMAAAKKG